MRQAWILGGLGVLALGMAGGVLPVGAEPTKYCGERIAEAQDTVQAIEAALGRVTDTGDKSEIEGWVRQAKAHIGNARSAAQEDDCVRQVELAKTLTQDALYLAAQSR